MSRKPELLAALQDPSRVFNMDETSVQIGSSGHRVLAEKNTKVLYSISSGSRDHITACYMVSANGSIVPPRLVFKGVRNVAQTHLKNLPKDGKSGDWQMSVSPKGFVTRELHMEILHDLDKFLVTNEINRPVILFLDGASPHISLDALKFCKEKNIQPWLFRPNMTHLLQPLDLTFFSSLKSELKSIVWNWHGEVANAGQTLNKYSVVVLLQKATEKCLDKEGIISNGFRRAGLTPWDTTAPDVSKLLPGTIFSDSAHTADTAATAAIADTAEQAVTDPPSSSNNNLEHNNTSTEDMTVNENCQTSSTLDRETSDLADTSMVHNSFLDQAFIDEQSNMDPEMERSVDSSYFVEENSYLENLFQSPSPTDKDANIVSSHTEGSTVPKPYWTGHVKVCPNCSKRILDRLFSIHISSCVAQPVVPDPTTEVTPTPPTQLMSSVPQFSLAERATQLNKFEVLLLTLEQISEFNRHFTERNLDIMEPLFQAWLILKNASLPTESQALQEVIANHTATNIPKKKTTRKRNLPDGPARYDINSQEWENILIEQASNKPGPAAKKSKEGRKTPPRPAGKATQGKKTQEKSAGKSGHKKVRL
jgi:hypothetical protein